MKKPLEHWNLQWVRQIRQTQFNEIHEVKDSIGNRYILRVTTPDKQRDQMWADLSRNALPYISKVVSLLKTPEKSYILEAYFQGLPLKDGKTLGTSIHHKEICLVGIQIAKCLKILYQKKGILHLDIKPENILMDEYGNAALIDFGAGISRIEGCNMLNTLQMGTPSYMSPERYTEPNAIGPMSDLYSLALTLKYMMTASENRHFSLWQFLSHWCENHRFNELKVLENAVLYDLFIQGLWEHMAN